MIIGQVTAGREAVVFLTVGGPSGRSINLNAVIDTGFTDYLTISHDIVDRLGLPFRESRMYELANGSLASFDVYEARVLWDDQWRDVLVSVAEGGPLIGMALVEGCRLSMHVIDGGQVEIRMPDT